MKALWLAAVAVGCGAKPPEPLESPPARPRPPPAAPEPPSLPVAVAAPRPDITVAPLPTPDLAEQARWPLAIGSHPALEPRFPIEAHLGITWTDACARGAQNRHTSGSSELLEYLRVWCSVAKRDTDGAVAQLARLQGAVTADMARAVKLDIADILVDHGSADEAEALLARNQIWDSEIVDLVAATYVEAGHPQDALEINRYALERTAPDAAICHRIVRAIALDDPALQGRIDQLHEFADETRARREKRAVDSTCLALDHEVSCSRSPGECDRFFADRGTDRDVVLVATAFALWPQRATDSGTWVSIAKTASESRKQPEADLLGLRAVEAAMRASRCNLQALDAIWGPLAKIDRRNRPRPLLHDRFVTELELVLDAASTLFADGRAGCVARLPTLKFDEP